MSEQRPVIGITPQWREKKDPFHPRVDLNSCYPTAIWKAGGVPSCLCPTMEPDAIAALVETLDGVIMTGGDDVDLKRYGQEPHKTTKRLPEMRDEFDMMLLAAALERGLPILGVCLGHQQVNIIRGGDLHQYLPDVLDEWTIEHRWIERDTETLPRHEATIDADSRLAKVLGGTRINVNSSHRQGIKRVGEGLRIVAHSDDGVVEGMESIDGDQILAVQWHPEEIHDEAPHFALFQDIVDRARRFAHEA